MPYQQSNQKPAGYSATQTLRLDQVLTIYGRKPVLEALKDPELLPVRLHLASTNKAGGVLNDIIAEAERQGIEIRTHERGTLSRISKNGKQDQGVALDLECPQFSRLDHWVEGPARPRQTTLLALDGITNPQNVGMIIRSAVAAGINGVVYPHDGVAALGPLVIKASVGTVFKAPILRFGELTSALSLLKAHGFLIATLEGGANQSLFEFQTSQPVVFVMGGETEGVSAETQSLSDVQLQIPMANNVESLNVAVAATLVAYRAKFTALSNGDR